MEFMGNILIFLLIFSIICGLGGIFYCQNNTIKITCLAVSYTNLMILFIIFAKNSQQSSQFLSLIPTILILFAITLAIGGAIISNIAKLNNQKSANH